MIVMVRRSGASLATVVARGNRHNVLRKHIGSCWWAPRPPSSSVSAAGWPVRWEPHVEVSWASAPGWGPFVPKFFGTRFVSRTPPGNADPRTKRRWTWLLAAGANTLILWFVFGPGNPTVGARADGAPCGRPTRQGPVPRSVTARYDQSRLQRLRCERSRTWTKAELSSLPVRTTLRRSP